LRARQDIISLLVDAREGDDALTDAEINGALHALAIAGDTTNRALSSALYYLLTTPSLMDDVSNDRTLVASFLDESLRLAPAAPLVGRRALTDVEVAGIDIPEGSSVFANVQMADRDPSIWEHPDDFRLGRPRRATLAFAQGAHICPGMHLARLMMSAGLNVLFDRCPRVRLDPLRPVPELTGLSLFGARSLPVLMA
jgi:cytochrome P450